MYGPIQVLVTSSVTYVKIIDAPSDVAFERRRYMERIIRTGYYIRTEALRGENNSSCILRANGSCDGTLRR
jgi:hypothetical protein